MSDFSGKVLRTIYLPPTLYEQVKWLAYSRKISFSELAEEFIIIGMIADKIVPSGKF